VKKYEKMSEEKKHYIAKILTFIVITLFIILLQVLMNLDSITFLCNMSSYDVIDVKVKSPSTDEFIMMIPKVDIEYTYNGESYEESKYFVLQPLFGMKANVGEILPAYVNINAPKYTLFKVNFFTNWLNYILLLFDVVCVCRIITYIKRQDAMRKELKEKKKGGQK